jgi:hypothetical protein
MQNAQGFALGGNLAAFYNINDSYSPSFVRRDGQDLIVKINQKDERFLYEIKNGVVTNAIVEKWFNAERVTVEYRLQNSKYKISKIYRTNRAIYFSEKKDLRCEKGWTDKISELLGKIKDDQFVDESCGGRQGQVVNAFKGYLDPKNENQGRSLLECIERISAQVQNSEIKKKYSDLLFSMEALMQKEIDTSGSAIIIYCTKDKAFKENKLVEGMCDPKNGKLTIGSIAQPVSDDDNKNFIHELVHFAHGLSNDSNQEEGLAENISQTCYNDKWKNETSTIHGNASVLDLQPKPDSDAKQELHDTAPGKVADAIPVQNVDTQAVGTLSNLASNTAKTNPENSTASNSALNAVFERTNNSFSTATRAIAQASLPLAHAGSVSSSKSVSTGSSVTKSTAPASKYNVVEQIIVPTDKPNTYTVTTKTYGTPAPATIAETGGDQVAAKLKTTSPSRVPSSVGAPEAVTNGGSGYIGPTFDGVAPTGKQAVRRTDTDRRTEVSINGLSFSQKNVTTVEYKKYKSELSKQEFKSALEKAGILITNGQKPLTQPRKVNAFYKDTGSELVYGGP